MSLEAIIPIYKPDDKLADIVDRLNSQYIKPDLITLIVSTDNPENPEETEYFEQPEFKALNVRILYIDKKEFGHGKTRQQAMNDSNADYVLFMTQDAVPFNNKLTLKLLESINRPYTAAAYARQLPNKDAKPVERFSRLFNYRKTSYTSTAADLKTKGVKAIFLSDSCAIYNRDIHNMLGGFDCTVNFNEDCMYAYKALNEGYTIEYCAEAKVYHSHNFKLIQNFKRNRDIGLCQKQHPEVFGNIVSEKEGIKYVLTGIKYFAVKKQYINIFSLILNSAVRYTGFWIGKHTKDTD